MIANLLVNKRVVENDLSLCYAMENNILLLSFDNYPFHWKSDTISYVYKEPILIFNNEYNIHDWFIKYIYKKNTEFKYYRVTKRKFKMLINIIRRVLKTSDLTIFSEEHKEQDLVNLGIVYEELKRIKKEFDWDNEILYYRLTET